MKRSVFITGGSGLIGRHLLRKISLEKYENIHCLSRRELPATVPEQHKHFKFIKGDIFDANAYSSYLKGSDLVVHLAAVTGKAKPEEYFKVNAEGTKFLVKQCQQQGVPTFIYLSSIATKFRGKSRYHYAQSKELGEAAVTASALNYAILRPTIVIGKEAPIWQRLSNLARQPLVPMPANDHTRIQPIYIDDLVDCILALIEEKTLRKEALDVGGPETLGFKSFIKRIHHAYHGKNPIIIPLPLKPFIPIFSLVERRFYSLLPFNVGQLSSFYQDSTIESNWLFEQYSRKMKNVDEMLALVVNHA